MTSEPKESLHTVLGVDADTQWFVSAEIFNAHAPFVHHWTARKKGEVELVITAIYQPEDFTKPTRVHFAVKPREMTDPR